MNGRDINRIATALLCVTMAVGTAVVAAKVLVPDSAPRRLAFAIPGLDADGVATNGAVASASGTVAPIAERLKLASSAHGAAIAADECGACHTLEPGAPSMVGPNLAGIAGGPVASVAGFSYSDALKGLGGVWTPARLDRWLTAPQTMAPGTRMGFAGLADAGQRADVIAFLQSIAVVGTTAPKAADDPGFASLVATADVKAGEADAASRCGACHGFDQGGAAMVGPNLYGVMGRGIAQAPDYRYSPALSAHRGSWTVAALGDWLADPQRFAPGTRMGFAGIADDKERAAVVAYLGSLSEAK